LKTSRTQVDKLLNPKDGNVAIATLHKGAAMVGKRFESKLVQTCGRAREARSALDVARCGGHGHRPGSRMTPCSAPLFSMS
jgi:hypothetical protein